MCGGQAERDKIKVCIVIARLFKSLGAEIEEDATSIEAFFKNGKNEKTGFYFMKNLFHNRIFYGDFNISEQPLYTCSAMVNGWSHYFHDKTTFYSDLSVIIKSVIKVLTGSKMLNVDTAWELLCTVNKQHATKPTRETLDLRRLIGTYVFQTRSSELRLNRRKANLSRAEDIKKLASIESKLPTLYKALKKQGLKTTKISSNYYRGDIRDCSAWGHSRGSMASQFYGFYKKDLSLSYNPPDIADFLNELIGDTEGATRQLVNT